MFGRSGIAVALQLAGLSSWLHGERLTFEQREAVRDFDIGDAKHFA